MSTKERILLALTHGCHVSIDASKIPPNDTLDIVTIAVQKGVAITLRGAMHISPTAFQTLVATGGAKLRVEF